MATRRWVGTAGLAGSFADAANWDPATIPVANDEVYFDSGSEDLDLTLDQSAITLDILCITEGFTGNIADGFKINATNFYERGSEGEHYFEGTYTTAIINNSSPEADGVHLDGTITNLLLFKGNVTLEAAATATTIQCGYAGNQVGDVDLTIEVGATVTTIWQNGGDITCGAAWTNLYLVAGSFTHTDTNATNIYVFDGSFDYQAAGHTLTSAVIYGGRFDTTGQYEALTVTDLEMWPGSVVDLRNQSNTVVITNGVLKHGGRLLVEEGTNLT